MGLVRRTILSKLDYQLIHEYIAADNKPAADKVLRTFDEKVALLSDMPGAGTSRPDLGKEVRSLPVGNYLLIYRPTAAGIELLRVIHGARKVRRVFRGGIP